MQDVISAAFQDHIRLANQVVGEQSSHIDQAARQMIRSLRDGGRILWCGNGGSAADSQHLAAELLGRFQRDRRALPSIALTTDTSVITAIGNDFGYENVFSRQIEGLASKQDTLIGISTSGNSENVIRAIREAKKIGAFTICLLGRDGGKLAKECDLAIVIPAKDTARIQEMHITIGHILCDLVEREFA